MNVYLYLNRPGETTSSIMLSVSYKSTRVQVSTGVTIEPKHWDKQKAKIKKSYGSNYINDDQKLRDYKKLTEDFCKNALQANTQLSSNDIKTFIRNMKQGITEKKSKTETVNLIEHLNKFISVRKSGKELNESTGKPFSQSIIKIYNTLKNHLIEFQKYKKIELKLEMINKDFYQQFTSYLFKVKNHKENTIGNMVKTLKTFLNWCLDKEIITNNKFRKEFKVVKKDTYKIYLHMSEIKKLFNYDFSNNIRLERARDLFLLHCFTGLRNSDVNRLSKKNINMRKKVIIIETKKTKEPVCIRMGNMTLSILKRYHDLNLPKLSQQNLNTYIKEAAFIAGITDIDPILGEPKCNLISSHTGRRTFITNKIKKHDRLLIKKVTGIISDATLEKYIRLLKEETAKIIGGF